MSASSPERASDGLVLLARVLLALLFLVFGWNKLMNYQATVGYMIQAGLPVAGITTIGVTAIEFLGGLLVIVGLWNRPIALLLALYTLGTALIGHHFWTLAPGPARTGNAINFYKNLGIIGGFLLLYITGPGKYSLDAMLGGRTRT